jgi:hypothetical protein
MEDVSWLAPLNVRIRTWGRDVANLAPAKKNEDKDQNWGKKKEKEKGPPNQGAVPNDPTIWRATPPRPSSWRESIEPPNFVPSKGPAD